ncbi:MAG: hypothetical protein WBW48_14855 [Anaerolineae bacterium]
MSDKEHATKATETAVRRPGKWIWQAESKHVAQAEVLPLRRDMVTLLTYLHENRVKGTQSTGNLPLKVVREVTGRFVYPPELDRAIGDYTFRVRSEDDVWPLYFLHSLAYVGRWLVGGPAQPLVVTLDGARFLTASPLVQVWMLFVTWWEGVDWLIAYPFTGMGESLPPRFQQIALAHLLSLPAETHIPFEPFADKLIRETGLKWTAPNMIFARDSLRGAIGRMVIGVLADFEMVEPEYQDKPLGKGTIPKLVAFKIASFGKGLLESLQA